MNHLGPFNACPYSFCSIAETTKRDIEISSRGNHARCFHFVKAQNSMFWIGPIRPLVMPRARSALRPSRRRYPCSRGCYPPTCQSVRTIHAPVRQCGYLGCLSTPVELLLRVRGHAAAGADGFVHPVALLGELVRRHRWHPFRVGAVETCVTVMRRRLREGMGCGPMQLSVSRISIGFTPRSQRM